MPHRDTKQLKNNSLWPANQACQARLAGLAGQPGRPGMVAWPGQPDLAGLARGMGLEAPDPIIDLADLQAALIYSLERVENGAAVVLDVRVRQEYVGDGMVELS